MGAAEPLCNLSGRRDRGIRVPSILVGHDQRLRVGTPECPGKQECVTSYRTERGSWFTSKPVLVPVSTRVRGTIWPIAFGGPSNLWRISQVVCIARLLVLLCSRAAMSTKIRRDSWRCSRCSRCSMLFMLFMIWSKSSNHATAECMGNQSWRGLCDDDVPHCLDDYVRLRHPRARAAGA